MSVFSDAWLVRIRMAALVLIVATVPVTLLPTAPTRIENQALVSGNVVGPRGEIPKAAQVSLSYPFRDRDFCRQSIEPDKDGSFAFAPVNGAADYLLTAKAEGYKTQVVLVDLSKGDAKVKIILKKL